MEKIQIGDYVRTDKGNIGRVIEKRLAEYISAKTIITKYTLDTGEWTTDLYIKKHSKELINLIEVGDLVEIIDVLYQEIIHIWDDEMLKAVREDIENGLKIGRILTKEKFKNNSYKVVE